MKQDENLGKLNINSSIYKTRLSKKFLSRKTYKPADPGKILSFIPGTVLDILVKEGQKVGEGDDLMILDAMKMQNKLKSPARGTIRKIHVQKGDKVSKGTLLIELK
ncbi:MAG: acetyl-CoA carboxylase biotin carboxyl carrier protein subunit [Bacteroidales bacterium]